MKRRKRGGTYDHDLLLFDAPVEGGSTYKMVDTTHLEIPLQRHIRQVLRTASLLRDFRPLRTNGLNPASNITGVLDRGINHLIGRRQEDVDDRDLVLDEVPKGFDKSVRHDRGIGWSNREPHLVRVCAINRSWYVGVRHGQALDSTLSFELLDDPNASLAVVPVGILALMDDQVAPLFNDTRLSELCLDQVPGGELRALLASVVLNIGGVQDAGGNGHHLRRHLDVERSLQQKSQH